MSGKGKRSSTRPLTATVIAVIRTAIDQRRLSSSNRPLGPAMSDMTTLNAMGTISCGTDEIVQTRRASGTTAVGGTTNGRMPMAA